MPQTGHVVHDITEKNVPLFHFISKHLIHFPLVTLNITEILKADMDMQVHTDAHKTDTQLPLLRTVNTFLETERK